MRFTGTPLERAPRRHDLIEDRRIVGGVLVALSILSGIAVGSILWLFTTYSHHAGLLRVFFTAMVLSAGLTAITVVILRWLDRRDPLPGLVYIGLLLWGAVLSCGLALPINQRVLDAIDR